MVDMLIDGCEGLATGLYPVDMESFKLEQVLQRHCDIWVVLDDQYGMHRSRIDRDIHIWARRWF